MRWLGGLVVLGACQFTHGALPSDASEQGSGSDDGGMVTMIDAPPDSTMGMQSSARVRMIDFTDAQITGGPHVDFPVLVSLSATWLMDTGHGGDVARTDGFDIYFSADQLGAVRLAHEIERYTSTTGTLVAWVKVPTLTASSVIYLHYGDTTITTDPSNPTAVWSGNYQLVMHLGQVADSTGKNTSFSTSNAGTTPGQIDQARSFDGAQSLIGVGSQAAIDDVFAAGGTAETWFYAQSFGEAGYGRFFEKGNADGWAMCVNDTDVTASLSFVHGSGSNGWGQWDAPANSVTLNAWHHVAIAYSQATSVDSPTIYIDGREVTANESTAPSGPMDSDASFNLYLGNRSSLDRTFDGWLDEMRLSNVSRSADWIATGYRNQLDPGSFYTVSAPL